MLSALQYQTPETIAETKGDYSCVKGTPWEKIASTIPPNASVKETLQVAGLDWKVIRARSELIFENESGEKVRMENPKSFGIVRSSDYKILSPFMGNRYKPIQNEDAFEVFAEFIQAGQMTMETAGSLCDGLHVWCLASFGKGFELANGEIIKGYFLLMQSHRYGNALRAMFTPVRYPGGHTLVQNISLDGVNTRSTYSMSHARVFDEKRVNEIHKLLGIAEKGMDDFVNKVRFMSRQNFSEEQGVIYLARVFNPQLIARKKLDREPMPLSLLELIEDGDANKQVKQAASMVLDNSVPGSTNDRSAWGYFNTVNHIFDHVTGAGVNTRLETAWLGKNAVKKVKAFDLSEVMASQV